MFQAYNSNNLTSLSVCMVLICCLSNRLFYIFLVFCCFCCCYFAFL